MHDEELVHQGLEIARSCRGDPALDHLAAVYRHQRLQLVRERRGIGDEVPVLVLEQRYPQLLWRLHAHARGAAHGIQQRVGYLDDADLAAFRLHVHRTRRIEVLQRREQSGIEALLRWLRIAGKIAQQRAAVTREVLQIQDLRTFVAQRGEQPALARTRETTHDHKAQSRRRGGQ